MGTEGYALRFGLGRPGVLVGALACLFALALASPGRAQVASLPDVAVTPEEKDAFQEPNLAVDPTDPNRLATAYLEGNRRAYCAVARSRDGGRTWNTERVVGKGAPYPLPENYPQCYDTMVAYGPDGTLYYLYNPYPGTNRLGQRQVILTVSRNGGPFEQPKEVDPIGPGADRTDLYSEIRVDRASGRVYVSWIRYCEPGGALEPLAAVECNPGPGQLQLVSSGDGGRTFSRPVRVSSPSSPNPARHTLAIDAGGTVYGSWYDGFFEPPRPLTLYVASSRDEGKSFGEPKAVGAVNRCSGEDLCYDPSTGGGFFHAVGGKPGELFITFWDKVDGKFRVFFTASKDGGASFSEPRVVGIPAGGGGHEQHRPRLARTPQGKLYVAYYDFRPEGEGGFHDVYLIESTDEGASFSAPRRISDVSSNARVGSTGRTSGRRLANFGQRLGLASTPDGVPLIAWTDSRRGTELSGKQDIFFEGAGAGGRGPGANGRSPGANGRSPAVNVEGCLNFRPGVRGRRLGPARLGRSRRADRRLFKGARRRLAAGLDRYCVAGGGFLRIGYPNRRLNRGLSRPVRRRIRGRAVLVVTSSRRYRIRGIRAGSSTRAVRRRLRGERRVRVGPNVWYVARGRGSRHVFKTRGGKVREIGIADKRLSASRRGATRLLRAYKRGR